jgi:TonB family protein
MKTMTRYIVSSLFIVPLALSLSVGEGMARNQLGLTADDVKSVINDGSEGVQKCYRRHVKKQKNADGKFLLHLGVNPSGKVAEVEVEAPTIRGKKFERCVERVAKKWRFPKAGSGTDVTYPFLFVHGSRHARNTHRRSRR